MTNLSNKKICVPENGIFYSEENVQKAINKFRDELLKDFSLDKLYSMLNIEVALKNAFGEELTK